MIEREIDVKTPDGTMTTFVHHPRHDGPHPVVLYLMDAPSIRPALREMAARLASAGYYVMLPYLYYRGGPYREFGATDDDMHARGELMKTVTPAGIVGDAQALLDVADADAAARSDRVGAVGFCMSGGLTLAVARAMPERFVAAASIHGAWMVRDGDDSPHLGLEGIGAEVYLAWCDNDPTAPVEHLDTLRAALEAAGVPHTVDFFEDAVHGFAPPGSERYNRAASELHWERVHSLLRRRLLCPT
ncbi:MAG TPA: dienelactone hydrolase family protein [Acidimicrobiales bacterium]|nr:dienelactone hydrolase family protein [Acidimicrobiales bacterium]